MDEAKKKLLVRSMIIGGTVGSILVLANKTNLCEQAKKCYSSAVDFAKLINSNRGTIVDQVKKTSDKVTKAIDETNHDLKEISKNIKHLKESSSDMIQTVIETKDDLMTMYEACKDSQKIT